MQAMKDGRTFAFLPALLVASIAAGCGDSGSTANGGTGGTTNSTWPAGTGGVPGGGGAGGTYAWPAGGTVGSGGTRTLASGYDACEVTTPLPKTFTRVDSMTTTRYQHTATLLPDGKVLITGGTSNGQVVASAELFDPAVGSFRATGGMMAARSGHTATLLANGQVLIAGGDQLASAELFDPKSETFAATGAMSVARATHTATLLAGGKVLMAGGDAGSVAPTLGSAELYDPATGGFSATGDMTTVREQHAAALLPDGQVLLLGGFVEPSVRSGQIGLASAEIYDPTTGRFAATGSMGSWKVWPAVASLPDGTVLVGGGPLDFEGYVDRSNLEIYDPAVGQFTYTGALAMSRARFTMTLLPGGSVLIAGGSQFGPGSAERYLASAEVYDPATRTSALAACMTSARTWHTATALADGRVLVAGGFPGEGPDPALATADIYR